MTGFSKQVRVTVRERSAGWCERCDRKFGEHAHHRRVKGAGGSRRESTHQASNALWLCMDCHDDIHGEVGQALENGWLVSQYADPAQTRVLYRGRWVLLDDNGTWKTAVE